MEDTRERTPFLVSLQTICKPRCGKVRDIYDVGDQLFIVSSDRVSAFDWVLPNVIPDKGRVLQLMTGYWHDRLQTQNDVITTSISAMPGHNGLLDCLSDSIQSLAGRTVLVNKLQVIPLECVVRGYLAGSGWKEYQQSQSVCGIDLPADLVECAQLPEPIFTPTTKADTGHDEPLTPDGARAHLWSWLNETLGTNSAHKPWATELFTTMSQVALDLYTRGAALALEKELIIADTKFELALVPRDTGRISRLNWELRVVDEVLTPDSSRYWPGNEYAPGRPQNSFDKQLVRDWLADEAGWDKNSPPPELPDEIVTRARERYIELYERLTKDDFAWK
ncbi:phosphoribosylaminoimidazolesuccinocarboxamide synthase [bacterium]|nr:phosphoribosylaminoimidazolesuccinocarboxamide synthase [bacterium]